MVIKILKNSSTFNGIDYSEKKAQKGEGNLLSAENFPFDEMEPKDYNDYLEAQSDLNKRVKNKQLHVSISTRGREHNFEELTKVAKDYMKFMGYGENPYLIYAHRDSPNNHVHIVSTRVDENGKKISDSLEKVRTQKYIEKELNINFSSNVDSAIKESFKYKFKETGSLESLLRKEGFKTRMNKKGLEVIKSGKVQRTIPKRKIKDHIYFSKIDYADKNKIKAQMYRYSAGTDYQFLKSSLREKFGMELSYQYNTDRIEANQERRNMDITDYYLFDHREKVVYSSKDLLSVDKLKTEFESVLSLEEISQSLSEINSDPVPYSELRDFFSNHNLGLNYNGEIKLPSGEPVAAVNEETLEKVKYLQRIMDFKQLDYSANVSASILSKIFKIDMGDMDMRPKELTNEDRDLYRELAKSNLEKDGNSVSNSGNIKIYNTGDGPVLFDYAEKRVLHIEKDLGIKVDMQKIIPPVSRDFEPMVRDRNLSVPEIADIYTDDLNTSDQRKKRKRKRQQNMNR